MMNDIVEKKRELGIQPIPPPAWRIPDDPKKCKELLRYLDWFITRPVHEQFFLESTLPHCEVIHKDGNDNQARTESTGISPAHNAPANTCEFDEPASPE